MVTPLTSIEVEKQLSAGQIAPFYLLLGEETYLKRALGEKLRAMLLSPDTADFNYTVFFAAETELRDVLDMARTQPAFAKRRLVIVRNVEKYAGQEKMLVNFLSRPLAHACVVLDTEKDLRDKFIHQLAQPAVVCVAADRLEGRQLRHWISVFVRKEGKKISAPALETLLSRVEPELELLARALRLVCQYKQDADIIQPEDIKAMVGKTRVDSRFTLLNELMERRANTALEIATEVSQDGRYVVDLIGLINWQLRQVKGYSLLAQEGLAAAQIGKSLNISQYALRRVSQYAAQFTIAELERASALLLETDAAIKKGLKSPLLALQTFIVEFCALQPAPRN